MLAKIWTEPIAGFDPWAHPGDALFYPRLAKWACDWFPQNLTHFEGEFAGKPFELLPWQKKLVGHLFGWLNPDGTRRFRTLFLYVPRKNGKTTLAAGLSLLLFAEDGEPGAQIYVGAKTREQAGILYDHAATLLNAETIERCGLQIPTGKNARKMYCDEYNSVLRAVSRDAGSMQGYNPSVGIIDELHVQPDRKLTEAFIKGMMARKQPLMAYLTTAAEEGENACNEELHAAIQVRDGVVVNPSYFPVIFAADEKDDISDEAVWIKANPSIGYATKLENIRKEFSEINGSIEKLISFKRYILNMHTKASAAWVDLAYWDENSGNINPEELTGQKCFAGIDLSSTSDITAIVLYFPESKAILPRFFVPKETARRKLEYEYWEKKGLLKIAGGDCINDVEVEQEILQLAADYNILQLAYDPHGMAHMARRLTDQGLEMVPFRQGTLSMNEPTKLTEKMILQKELQHGGNPVLRWMITNARTVQDNNGCVRIAKENKDSPRKVDGVVAMIMAIGQWMKFDIEDNANKSVYEERGLRV